VALVIMENRRVVLLIAEAEETAVQAEDIEVHLAVTLHLGAEAAVHRPTTRSMSHRLRNIQAVVNMHSKQSP